MSAHECIYCRENQAIGDHGLCAHCVWVVRAEVEVGLRELNDYLAHWVRYQDWCADRGVVA